MKNPITLTLIFTLVSGCISLHQSSFSDYTLDKSEEHFNSYYISSNEQLSPELKSTFESVVQTKMNALGYIQSDKHPDLTIHYQIYDSTIKIHAPVILMYESESEQPEKTRYQEMKLKNGAIYISMYNKEKDQIVWRGYTNGFSKTPRIVKAKAFEILDQFTILAEPKEVVASASQIIQEDF